MTSMDTMAYWRRRWPRVSPTRKSGANYQRPDAPHIDVHEIRGCLVADTTTMQRQGRIPDAMLSPFRWKLPEP